MVGPPPDLSASKVLPDYCRVGLLRVEPNAPSCWKARLQARLSEQMAIFSCLLAFPVQLDILGQGDLRTEAEQLQQQLQGPTRVNQ